jgi:hypothetical protein
MFTVRHGQVTFILWYYCGLSISQYNSLSHPELSPYIRIPKVSRTEYTSRGEVNTELGIKGKKIEVERCICSRSSARHPQLLQLTTQKGRNHALGKVPFMRVTFYLRICLARPSRPFLHKCSLDKNLCNSIPGKIPQVIRQDISRRVLQTYLYSSNVNFNMMSSYKLHAPGKQCPKSLAALQYPAVHFRRRLVSLVPVMQQPLRIENAVTTKLQ